MPEGDEKTELIRRLQRIESTDERDLCYSTSRATHWTVAPCPVVPFPTALSPTRRDRCSFPASPFTGSTHSGRSTTFPWPADLSIDTSCTPTAWSNWPVCGRINENSGHWSAEKSAAIEQACREMADGKLDDHIVVDALQGGAGTSTNMNVNEVLANRALQILRQPLGTYALVHPLDDLNLHQSTNDTFPTALKVAAIGQFRGLERDVTSLPRCLPGQGTGVRPHREGRSYSVAGRGAHDTGAGASVLSPMPSCATAGGCPSVKNGSG